MPVLLNLLRQTGGLWRRWGRAKRFAIPYSRDTKWLVPREISIGGKRIGLSLPGDEGSSIALKDIFVSDVYGLEKIERADIRSVLDIGAHAGLFSLAARHYFPDSTIHAYEPNPELWPHLQAHAGQAAFVAFREAVGAVEGHAQLILGKDTVFTHCRSDDAGEVTVTAIANAIERVAGNGCVDLLKMDCEGAEWEILKASAAFQNVRLIRMEYHLRPGRSLPELHRLLHGLGFIVDSEQCDGADYGRIFASRDGAGRSSS